MAKASLQEQVKEIVARAEEKGVEGNFFFVTTLKRYQVQMKMLSQLEKEINDLGTMVRKEYVKGRKNVYANPAIGEYNKTATAANNTVQTLIKIIDSFTGDEDQSGSIAKLMQELMRDDEDG